MLRLASFEADLLQIPLLTLPSLQHLPPSPTFSPRSAKDHSIPETNCSHLSATLIIDSEEEPPQTFSQEEECEDYLLEGCCMKGRQCAFGHGEREGRTDRLPRGVLLQNFPELVALGVRR